MIAAMIATVTAAVITTMTAAMIATVVAWRINMGRIMMDVQGIMHMQGIVVDMQGIVMDVQGVVVVIMRGVAQSGWVTIFRCAKKALRSIVHNGKGIFLTGKEHRQQGECAEKY